MRLRDAEDGGDEVIAKAKFEVSGVSREVFSLGKLVNDGAISYFATGNCWLTKQGKSVTRCERTNTFFMPVEVLDNPVKPVWQVCAAEDSYQGEAFDNMMAPFNPDGRARDGRAGGGAR